MGKKAKEHRKKVAVRNQKLKAEQTFYLEQDIFTERQITPFTKAKVLLYKKGSQIPLLEAERLGLWSSQES
jgi:hypothetical protein